MKIKYKLYGDKEYQGISQFRMDFVTTGFNEFEGKFWLKCDLGRELYFQTSSKKVRDTVYDALKKITLAVENGQDRHINIFPIGVIASDKEAVESEVCTLIVEPIEPILEIDDDNQDEEEVNYFCKSL